MSSDNKVTVEIGRGSSAIEAARNLSSGTVPSNQVMLDTLSAAQNSVAQSGASLDSHGQQIAKDSEQLIEATKNLLLAKNSDGKLQEVLQSGQSAARTGADSNVIRPRGQTKLVGEDLSRTARNLAQLLGQSTELRSLFTEQLQTLQNLFYKRKNQQTTTPAAQAPMSSHMDPEFTTITLTQEEKRELISSWTQLITRLGSKPSYGNAMNDLFVLVDHLGDLTETVQADPSAQNAASQSANTMTGVRELAERFMGNKNLDNLIQMLKNFYRFTTEHPEIRQFGSDWSDFASETMIQPQLLHDPKYKARMDELVDRTMYWMNVRYFRSQSRAIADEARDILEAVKQDPELNNMQEAFNNLFRDMLHDSNGNLSVSQLSSALPSLKNLLAPILINQFNYIPINRVCGVTPKYDFELSNVVLCASDLIPDRFFLDLHTKADVGLSSESSDRMITSLTLKVTNITADMKNVNFSYQRKKLPRMDDEGIVDVAVPAPGATIKMVWEFRSSSKRPFTVVFRKAKCNVETVKVNVVKAKHSILDKIASKLFAGQMTTRLESAVADGLTSMGNSLADRMNRAVRNQAQPPSSVHVEAELKGDAMTATVSDNKSDTTPVTVGRV